MRLKYSIPIALALGFFSVIAGATPLVEVEIGDPTNTTSYGRSFSSYWQQEAPNFLEKFKGPNADKTILLSANQHRARVFLRINMSPEEAIKSSVLIESLQLTKNISIFLSAKSLKAESSKMNGRAIDYKAKADLANVVVIVDSKPILLSVLLKRVSQQPPMFDNLDQALNDLPTEKVSSSHAFANGGRSGNDGNTPINIQVDEGTPDSKSPPARTSIEHKAPTTNSAKGFLEPSEIANLEEQLGKWVMGQPEAVKMTVAAIRSKVRRPDSPRPVALLYIGPTGTGKSELSKGLAIAGFGSEKALFSFDLSTIKDIYQLNNLFGSAAGYIGPDVPPFEAFLKSHRRGVIRFDEIGNMGDPSRPEVRTSMLQTFYGMLDDGKWRSPKSGAVYDLRNFVFQFTGNEGQELFQGAPNDDIRNAVWNENNDSAGTEAVLKRNSWPEALIPRFRGNIALFRPLSTSARIVIAEKMTRKALSELKVSLGLGDVRFDKNFFSTIADSFFSHSLGARQMEAVTEVAVGDLIETATDHIDNVKDAVLTLSLDDNHASADGSTIRLKKGEESNREVILSVSVDVPGQARAVFKSNLTSKAVRKAISTREEKLMHSIHEAAHAVGNDPKKTNRFVALVSINSSGGMGGYVRYVNSKLGEALTRETVTNQIATLLIGGLAEQKLRPSRGASSGWQSDIEEARKLASHSIIKYGLSENSLKFPLIDGKVDQSSPVVQTEILRLLDESEHLAKAILDARWPMIRKVAARLLKSNGDLNREAYEEIVYGPAKKTIPASCAAIF